MIVLASSCAASGESPSEASPRAWGQWVGGQGGAEEGGGKQIDQSAADVGSSQGLGVRG